MNTDHVLYRLEGHSAVITLNRSEAKNAFSPEMIGLWQDGLKNAKADDRVRIIVLTGQGDTFCSGGDIRDMAEGKLRSWDMKQFLWEGVHRIVLALEDLDKPIMCDLRVCSDRARFAESYILMGLVPGDGGAYFLPRLVGLPKALELLLTGDIMDAPEALRLGLVNKVIPHDLLLEQTLNLAEKIASRPPLALRLMKRAVYQAYINGLKIVWTYGFGSSSSFTDGN